jgi:hypothetical protein
LHWRASRLNITHFRHVPRRQPITLPASLIEEAFIRDNPFPVAGRNHHRHAARATK